MTRRKDVEATPDKLVPDPQVLKEFGITNMCLWRWDQDPRVGFPPKIKIGPRNYRSRHLIEEFKAKLFREAIENQKTAYKRDKLKLRHRKELADAPSP
jgi:predicted DNA-binding transcriptional regulator AlpA